jgi:AAA15 family ATPase/GTPase
MEINRLYLENFKSIKGPIFLDIAPITLLYGQNSVGKSAIYDAIELFKKLCDNKKLPDIKNYFHKYDDNFSLVVGASFSTLGFLYDLDEIYINGIYSSLDQIENLSAIFENGYKSVTSKLGYEHKVGYEFEVIFTLANSSYKKIEIIESKTILLEVNAEREIIKVNYRHPLILEISKILSIELYKDFTELCESVFHNGYEIYSEFIELPLENYNAFELPLDITLWGSDSLYLNQKCAGDYECQIFLSLIRCLIFGPIYSVHLHPSIEGIGPLRIVPNSELLSSIVKEEKKNSIVDRNQLVSNFQPYQWNWYDGSIAWKYLSENNRYKIDSFNLIFDPYIEKDEYEKEGLYDLLNLVNVWLNSNDKLDIKYVLDRSSRRIEQESDRCNDSQDLLVKISLLDKQLQINIDVESVGTGISQIVPILVSGFLEGDFFIAQPELHLHPKLQSELSDFFISRYNENGKRFIIETHSEHIALRLLRRIRETTNSKNKHKRVSLKKEDIAFYYFDSKDGVTFISKLRATDDGDFLDRWPKGFFPEREKELFDEDF